MVVSSMHPCIQCVPLFFAFFLGLIFPGVARFRDLNRSRTPDPYEDPAQPVAERVEDLLGQTTMEESYRKILAGSSAPLK